MNLFGWILECRQLVPWINTNNAIYLGKSTAPAGFWRTKVVLHHFIDIGRLFPLQKTSLKVSIDKKGLGMLPGAFYPVKFTIPAGFAETKIHAGVVLLLNVTEVEFI